jgi:hypothetical protein
VPTVSTGKQIFFEWDEDRYRRAPVALDRIVRQELGALAKYLVEWMKQRGPKDTGVALESLIGYVDKFGEGSYQLILESRVPYAYWGLEYGRKPGAAPPFEKILGWVNRKSFNSTQLDDVHKVGKSIGSSYAVRKSPRNPGRRIQEVTSNYSFTTSEKVRAAFMIMRKIALRGTNEQRIFLRAISQTNTEQKLAILAIERRFFRAVNEGAF